MEASFAQAVAALKTPRDSDIFVTQVASAGTRFVGFNTIDHNQLAATMASYGQAALYTADSSQLVVTCHPLDESSSTVISVADLEREPHNLEPLGPTLHAGAVSEHTYRIGEEGVQSLLLDSIAAHPRVVKVFVSSRGIRILQAHDRKIQNGLTSVLSNGGAQPRSAPPPSLSTCRARRRPRRPNLSSSNTFLKPVPTHHAGKRSLRRSHSTTRQYLQRQQSSF